MLGDRVVLIGDAAGTVRPHTASGTSKAFGDAAALAGALGSARSGRADALQRWESHRRAHQVELADHGLLLARQSQLGDTGPRFGPLSSRATIDT